MAKLQLQNKMTGASLEGSCLPPMCPQFRTLPVRDLHSLLSIRPSSLLPLPRAPSRLQQAVDVRGPLRWKCKALTESLFFRCNSLPPGMAYKPATVRYNATAFIYAVEINAKAP